MRRIAIRTRNARISADRPGQEESSNHSDMFLDPEETLDPNDWDGAALMGHRIVDDGIAHLRGVRDRHVWTPPPEGVRAALQVPLPQEPTPLGEVYESFRREVLPYGMGNIHPRFWMWYMGAGSFTGALAEMLAAIDGSNLGGGDSAAALVDRQVVDWLKEIVGFPGTSSGTLVSGGSMANLIGLTVASNLRAGGDIRRDGIRGLPKPLRFYASDQVHGCHLKAMNMLGLGEAGLRIIPSDDEFELPPDRLADAIVEDRASNYQPVAVIANAGTVNSGALDDLLTIAAICRREDIWMRVDGCIGALVALAPDGRRGTGRGRFIGT